MVLRKKVDCILTNQDIQILFFRDRKTSLFRKPAYKYCEPQLIGNFVQNLLIDNFFNKILYQKLTVVNNIVNSNVAIIILENIQSLIMYFIFKKLITNHFEFIKLFL